MLSTIGTVACVDCFNWHSWPLVDGQCLSQFVDLSLIFFNSDDEIAIVFVQL
jgi:hypothetical protein